MRSCDTTSALTSPAHSQVADLTQFARHPDFHGATTHFAVGHKCLRAGTEVDFELERLPACLTLAPPGFILTDDGTVRVQGRKVEVPGTLEVPDHETLVAIPREVFAELVEQYGR